MIYSDEEALRRYDRIQELQETLGLNLASACTRVGVQPSSYGSLKKRVLKLRSEDERKES